MNEIETRLARIKRLSREQLDELQNVEREADKRWRAFADKPEQRGDGWSTAGAKKLNEIELPMQSFFSPRQAEQDRAKAIAVFFADKIVRKALAMARDTSSTYASECMAQHAADNLVWQSAPAIGSGAGDEVRSRLAEVGYHD